MLGKGIEMRFVMVHPKLGVLLTDPPVDGSAFDPAWDLKLHWSNQKGLTVPAAPTVASWAEGEMVLSRAKPGLTPEERRAIQLREVWPDGPDNTATPEACADALLPRWDVEDSK